MDIPGVQNTGKADSTEERENCDDGVRSFYLFGHNFNSPSKLRLMCCIEEPYIFYSFFLFLNHFALPWTVCPCLFQVNDEEESDLSEAQDYVKKVIINFRNI